MSQFLRNTRHAVFFNMKYGKYAPIRPQGRMGTTLKKMVYVTILITKFYSGNNLITVLQRPSYHYFFLITHDREPQMQITETNHSAYSFIYTFIFNYSKYKENNKTTNKTTR